MKARWSGGAVPSGDRRTDTDCRVRMPANRAGSPGRRTTRRFVSLVWPLVWWVSTAGAQPAPTSTKLAMIGDYGYQPSTTGAVAQLVHAWQPDAIISLGDNIYGASGNGRDNLGRWDELVGQYYGAYMLARSDGRYPTQTSPTQRFFPAPGNHDQAILSDVGQLADVGKLIGYLDFFHHDPAVVNGRLPSGMGRHDPSLTYYDFVLGDAHFFMLDTPHATTNVEALAEQQDWLRTGLLNSTTSWQFVVMHHPPYTSTSVKQVRPALQMPVQLWGADAVFSGDAHNYERLAVSEGAQQDMPYVINGLSGVGFLYPFGDPPYPASQVRFGGQHGAIRAEVTAQTATFEFVTTDGQIRDQWQLEQGAGPKITMEPGIRIGPAGEHSWVGTPNNRLTTTSGMSVGKTPDGAHQSALEFTITPALLEQLQADSSARVWLELTWNTNGVVPLQLHRLLRPWDAAADQGRQAGVDWVATPTATVTSPTLWQRVKLDVTADVRAWAAGAPNHGWAIVDQGPVFSAPLSLRTQAQVTLGPQLVFTRLSDDGQALPWSESLPGDLTQDYRVTDEDVDFLCHAMARTGDLAFDLTADQRVTLADLERWRTLAGVTSGNTNWAAGDGLVDSDDLLRLLAGWTGAGGSGRGWRHGNFDCDGDVDSGDLLELISRWTSVGAPPNARLVPEPHLGQGAVGLSLGLLVWFAGSRRRNMFSGSELG